MPADETDILDLCDVILMEKGLRQHRFDFLRGDAGHRLPVDAYYPKHNLAIEYHERQHTSAVAIMDHRMTVSGVTRGSQRKLYDDRRRKVLPGNGIKLIVLDYSFFKLTSAKRLMRDAASDEAVIRAHLNKL